MASWRRLAVRVTRNDKQFNQCAGDGKVMDGPASNCQLGVFGINIIDLTAISFLA